MPSYSELFGVPPDFRVSYSLISEADGGRWAPACQYTRWDFRNADKSVHTGTWMIWPEALTPAGELIAEGKIIPPHGLANMFCFGPGMRPFHWQHIRPGVRGYFVEGNRRIAVCEVVEVLGLHTNPAL